MKNERQEKILAIIAASAIETQEQLIDSLRKEGISCTQATISRDIKQLHLIKEPTGNGTYRYAVSTQKMRLNLADRLQTILRESIVSVDCAQNLVLIKTMAGLGPAAGAAFDGMDTKKFLNESLISFAVNISSIYLSLRLIFSKNCAKIACFYDIAKVCFNILCKGTCFVQVALIRFRHIDNVYFARSRK